MNYQKLKCKLKYKRKEYGVLLHSVLITNITTLTLNK